MQPSRAAPTYFRTLCLAGEPASVAWRRLLLGHSGEEPILFVLRPVDRASLGWELLLQQFPGLLES